MNSQAETLVILVLVGSAALYIARKVWLAVAKARRDRSAPGCGTDGCCK